MKNHKAGTPMMNLNIRLRFRLKKLAMIYLYLSREATLMNAAATREAIITDKLRQNLRVQDDLVSQSVMDCFLGDLKNTDHYFMMSPCWQI